MSRETSPANSNSVLDKKNSESFKFPLRYTDIIRVPQTKKITATDTSANIQVCIAERSLLDTKEFPNCVRELELCVKLNHKNIAQILNLFITPASIDSFFIVYEYFEYDLSHIVTYRGWLDTKGGHGGANRLSFVAYQLFCALRYLHHANIVHRDIRLESILLNSRCRVKLACLSKARHLSEETVLNDDPGNDYYLAPEIFDKYNEHKEKWVVGKRSMEEFKPLFLPATSWDVWALGIVFLEVLNGKRCFEREELNNSPDKRVLIKKFAQEVAPIIDENLIPEHTHPKLKRSNGYDFFQKILAVDFTKRITAEAALKHEYILWKDRVGDKTSPNAHCITVGVDKVKITTAEWRSNLTKMISDYNKTHVVETWVPKKPEEV